MTRVHRFSSLFGALALLQACAGVGPARTVAQLPAPPQLRTVSAGADHMCGLTAAGSAWCWGANDYGQLGTGSLAGEAPRPVRVASGLTFSRLSAGAGYTCAVAVSGDVYCWGLNQDGQLGVMTQELCGGLPCSASPVRVRSGMRFDEVSAGFFHTCALSQGRAYCWGANHHGELGNTSHTPCAGLVCLALPQPVDGGLQFTAISARGEHTCGVSDRAVYCWGDNRYGELGIGTTEPAVWRPRRVASTVAFTDVQAGGIHTCALSTEGQVYCWGSNASRNLGSEAGDGSAVPILGGGGRAFVALTTGGAHTCALAADHTAWCWGSDAGDVLGAAATERCGAFTCSARPLEVAQVRDVSQLSAGGNGTCAIARDGLYCWGGTENLVLTAARRR